jgi:hypothetical protein
MARQRLIVLLINAIGGIAVIASYILGLRGEAGADVLWGGVPESIRPVYYVSMILSALGYFAFIYFILVKADPDKVVIGGRFGYSLFYPIFVLLLGASAFWMPLTNLYVGDPSTGIWIAVRVVLAIVGLASIALAWALLTLRPGNRGAAYWSAVVGSCYFAFHTAILDAILWASLFRD